MDVFDLRQSVIDEYSSYISSFINIRDVRIRECVKQELRDGLLWPEPLLQLNPSFESGGTIQELVQNDVLHPLCKRIFSNKEPGKAADPLTLHRHQREAMEAAAAGDSYLLTTGTGSGKSLSYIVPIVDFVLRQGSGQGVRALVIYPMNALANSQLGELEKFLSLGFEGETPPVTFRRYTGQEKGDERVAIIENPPDILLTNYVMAELMLTRPRERKIVNALQRSLRFLVLDELHTYRGRQGADVAMLVRRIRDLCGARPVQCVGTSATLAGGGTFAEQQTEVAAIASTIFGVPVKPARVIGETLRRVPLERTPSPSGVDHELKKRVEEYEQHSLASYEALRTDLLASWIESTFGLTSEAETGRLRRAQPISIGGNGGAAEQLSKRTGLPASDCRKAIEHALLAGYRICQPETQFPVFAFRLHQFISRGDAVYSSLEAPSRRYITTRGQQYVPGQRERILLPLAFCRECEHEYFVVRREVDNKADCVRYLPRDVREMERQEGTEAGFLYFNEEKPWPTDKESLIKQLPEGWIAVVDGSKQVKRNVRDRLPKEVHVGTDGTGQVNALPQFVLRHCQNLMRNGTAMWLLMARFQSNFGSGMAFMQSGFIVVTP